jgi:hypothetical protein
MRCRRWKRRDRGCSGRLAGGIASTEFVRTGAGRGDRCGLGVGFETCVAGTGDRTVSAAAVRTFFMILPSRTLGTLSCKHREQLQARRMIVTATACSATGMVRTCGWWV